MIRLEMLGYTSLRDPDVLSVRIEAGAFAGSPPLQRVLMKGFEWEQVDARPASLDDSIIEASPTGDLGRFIDAESNTMQMRVEWLDPALALPPEIWMARTDQAIWTITP